MTPDIVLRRARPGDVEGVARLFEGYRAFYKCPPAPEDARRFIGDRVAAGDSAILVAVEVSGPAEECVGFVQLYPAFSSLRMAPVWILNDLYVDAGHRGKGIAKRLMLAAKAHADATGACGLSLETAPDNSAARLLYESLGYSIDDSMLHYVLDWKRPAVEE